MKMMNRFILILLLVIASGLYDRSRNGNLHALHTMVIVSAPALKHNRSRSCRCFNGISVIVGKGIFSAIGSLSVRNKCTEIFFEDAVIFGRNVEIEENGFQGALADSFENSRVLYYDPRSISNSLEIPQEEIVLLTNYT